MKFDHHIHSCYSGDSHSKVEDIIKYSMKIGLDAIAISDHDTVKGSKKAMEIAKGQKNINSLIIVPSIEITTNKGHIIGLGLEEELKINQSPEEVIEKIHDENALAIIPHPYTYYRHGLFATINIENYIKHSKPNRKLKIDGVEVKNGRFLLGYGNYKTKKFSKNHNISPLGGSDSHFINAIGDCYSEMEFESVEDIFEAIRNNKTIAKGQKTSNRLIGKEFINKKIKRKYKRN
ncbi:MAG: PHP domain-containing protein [Methanobrevibacter sp.]|jgi:predicted metal-dependent phosphoesterase TrpH|nr:PHP domain-containing protein [Candidatus Methanoflexus mossambicus]